VNFLNVNKLIPRPLKKMLVCVRNCFVDQYAIKSYSQEGEDMILRRIFSNKPRGFFVDVGAHHPRRFSNTYFFYQQGWSGINIEPNPSAFRAFLSARGRDINLQVGVSDSPGVLTYFHFNEPALNTFDKNVVKSRLVNTPYKLVKTEEVAVDSLSNILRMHLPKETVIDFLSIDVEGFDLAVLHSNDWQLFRPKCVLAESLNMTLEDAMKGEIVSFMNSQGYVLFSKTYNTLIFYDKFS
jgi:FkbM family methyltransferase